MKQRLLIILLLGMALFNDAFAQGRKITGKVVSAEDTQPLPGVSVKVRGTIRGVLTDGDGNFSINASAGEVLIFTYIGFTEQTTSVPAAGNLPLIKLQSDTRILSEVVVTDGYAVQAKKAVTGAISTVSGADLENKPFATPLQALQGQTPGLNVAVGSGQPGANIQARIRGVSSIGADSNPLFVIDGMIINAGDLSRGTNTTNVLSGINENDIETITVLKDASATAIYGSRASNGVIVITTKKGKAGKTQVRFDAESGITNNLEIPEAGRPLNAQEYRSLFLEGLTNAGVTGAAQTPYITSYGLNNEGVDWYHLITKRGSQQQYNVSLTGGNEATQLFVSSGYFKQEATILASSLRRISGLLNLNHNFNKRFSLSTGLNFSNVNQYTPSEGGGFANPTLAAYFLRPFQNPYNADGTLNFTRTGNTNFPDTFNPLYIAANDKKYSSQTRVLGNTALKWNIWGDLKYTGYVSVDYNLLEEQVFANPLMGDGRTVTGRGSDYYTRYFNWLVRNQLDYRWNIPNVQDFYVNATVGYEAQKSNGYLITAQSTGFPLTQPLLTASANAAVPVIGRGTFANYSYNAIYAIASVNFKNKYALSATFRRDGSSRFGSNVQYGNFPSVGATWNIDQEDFFNIQHIFSSAKIRSSFGEMGNSAGLANYGWRPTAGYGFNYAGNNGQNFNTIGNIDLTWERSKEFDIGADFGFFKDRLTFTFDYYKRKIDHLIQTVPISQVTGFLTITQNIGAMQNTGEEISVKGIPIKNKDFTWTTNFNISFNQNKVTSLANAAQYVDATYPMLVKEGRDFRTWYLRQYAGVDPANGNSLWYTDESKTATTTNFSSAARVAAYQASPKYFGGFNNTFTYKGISLQADFYYNFGNMILDSWASFLNSGVNFNYNKYAYNLNRWQKPGDVTDVPAYTAGGIAANNGQENATSTRYLYYGDYIRLKNLTVGYDLKNLSLLKRLGVSRLYIYGRGTNVWTKTYDKRLPFDPEVGINSYSNLTVPQVRTFTLGLNIGL